MFLHQAIQEVLRQNHNAPMTIENIAGQINERGLYTKKDGSQPDFWDIGVRAVDNVFKSNSPVFDVLIRLR